MPNMNDFLWFALTALLLIAVILYIIIFRFKIKSKQFINNEINLKNDYENLRVKTEKEIDELKSVIANLNSENIQLVREVTSLTVDLRNLNDRVEYFKSETNHIKLKLDQTSQEKNHLKIENTKIETENQLLLNKLQEERNQLNAIQEKFEKEFENLANKIFDEKSKKFTVQNQENLDLILSPFKERIVELKNTVNEVYDKESKQRFSLGEKVKELAQLNQQISEDAKRLTNALKSDSKTQGNWGEMILESILEKSGLTKGREYFMEHQLTDIDNNALYSEFSGKKMRPDAVIKYPDERNVIIDSKVSLTAFIDMVNETDSEIYEMKKSQHLNSVKNHIQELSQKAYDDYDKSLDFVMMFIPSEPAYIAAMQADAELWNYAYNKRILLMSPGNLITSLKLISDLWKREYQNRNALEIAERGAKLYDKFVNFVNNLQNVGKNIDQAKSVYEQAYKQLYTGRDNLVVQTQKLKDLGLKTKKQLPASLFDETNPEPTEIDSKA